MANRRERPIARVNPSGEKVWRARATDPTGRRRYLGAFKLKREAQDAIDSAYEEWASSPAIRDTVGAYASDWTDRHPRSERTNYDRNSKLRKVLDLEIEGRRLRDWPFGELQRSHARDLVVFLQYREGHAPAHQHQAERGRDDASDDAQHPDRRIHVTAPSYA